MTGRIALMMVGFTGLLVAGACSQASSPPSGTASPAATQSAAAGQVTVTFATEPDPPKAGDNTFLVTVKQPDGTPVTDGSVTAVFSMPAMPSMNMPAMRSEATLGHQGAGTYRGTAQIAMGGTWNVAVAVSRSGQEVGTAHFSVVAK